MNDFAYIMREFYIFIIHRGAIAAYILCVHIVSYIVCANDATDSIIEQLRVEVAHLKMQNHKMEGILNKMILVVS